MKKLLSFLSVLITFQAIAQAPDTLTPLKKADFFRSKIKDNTIRAITPTDFRNAFRSITEMAAGRTPLVTMSELRAGKADTASIVQIKDTNKDGIFKYDATDISMPDDSVMVIRVGNKRYKRLTETIKAQWFGIIGDGIVDNTAGIQKALNATNGYTLEFEPGKIYKVTSPLNIVHPIYINLRNSTLRGVSVTKIFNIASNNVTISDGILDLNFTSFNGITGTGTASSLIENLTLNNVSIKSQKTTAGDQDGGIYLKCFSGVHITGGKIRDISNYELGGAIDHSPAIKVENSANVWFTDVHIKNAGVGINLYNVKNVFSKGVQIDSVNNNGYYIQAASENIDITGGFIKNFKDSGITFKTDGSYTTRTGESSVRVRGVEFINTPAFAAMYPASPMRGIGLRRGSGLIVSDCVFINPGVAMDQVSGFIGCDYVIFHDNIILNPTASATVKITDGKRFDIHNNTFVITNPSYTASYVLRFNNLKSSTIFGNKIYGTSGVSFGISLNGCDSLKIRDNQITGVINAYNDVSNLSTRIVYEQDGEVIGVVPTATAISNPDANLSARFRVKSSNASTAQGDIIGGYEIWSNDTSAPGASARIRLMGRVTNSTGSQHEAVFTVDGTESLVVSRSGKLTMQTINITALPVFADNTAAAALTVGDLYRTATGEVRFKY